MSKQEGVILIVDDNRGILSALTLLLSPQFTGVVVSSTPNRIDALIAEHTPDVVLLDMNFSTGRNNGNEGLYWLRRIKDISPDTEVVLFTAYAEIDLAVQGIKDGAFDFITKPWDNEKLSATLRNAYAMRRSRRQVRALKDFRNERSASTQMFWGNSKPMERMRETVGKVAATNANILITGENGTGKEMLAREIHALSKRSGELLVTVDLGALPESLFESELFGHTKGAFTDARNDRAGKFEIADNGTLFLDEIGNIPPHLQGKLLTAIQSGKIVRLGNNTPVDVDIRLISATNRNIYQMVEEGLFREDLLYRINTIHLELPPLRERREDIVPLAEIFLRRFSEKYAKKNTGFDAKARRKLAEHPWNGNIRELQHTVEKAVILSDGQIVEGEKLFLNTVNKRTSGMRISENSTLEDMEKRMIADAIERNDGNLSAVAQQLGITRQTLYNKIKRYDI